MDRREKEMTNFNSDEVADVMRRFESKYKRGMTKRDWNAYCRTLNGKYPDFNTSVIETFIPDPGVIS
jgi:hypothetical protein